MNGWRLLPRCGFFLILRKYLQSLPSGKSLHHRYLVLPKCVAETGPLPGHYHTGSVVPDPCCPDSWERTPREEGGAWAGQNGSWCTRNRGRERAMGKVTRREGSWGSVDSGGTGWRRNHMWQSFTPVRSGLPVLLWVFWGLMITTASDECLLCARHVTDQFIDPTQQSPVGAFYRGGSRWQS